MLNIWNVQNFNILKFLSTFNILYDKLLCFIAFLDTFVFLQPTFWKFWPDNYLKKYHRVPYHLFNQLIPTRHLSDHG